VTAQVTATNQAPANQPEIDLRALRRIHLATPGDSAPGGGISHMLPAAFAGYRELAAVRYDFPLVLWERGAAKVVQPLAGVLDDLIAATAEAERDGVRSLLFGLEREIKRFTATSRYAQLSELWACAADTLVAAAAEGAERERRAALLRAARASLGADGTVIECRADTARSVFAHAWDRLQADQVERERTSLERLTSGIEDILAADRALSPQAISPAALSASLGDQHAGGIDFEKLAAVLRTSKFHRPLAAARRRRLRQVLKVIKSELALLARGAGNGSRRRSTRRLATTCGSCEEALALFQSEIDRMVGLLRAVRIARLEIDNRYREERHDAFFESFGPDQLTSEERRALPPVLVYLDGDAIQPGDQSALLDILAADLPIKVMIEVTRIPAGRLSASGPAAVGGWLERFAGMATTLEGTFVMQAAVSHLPALAADLVAGLGFEGPALFAIYTCPREPREDLAPYLLAAAAVESRAFPCFVSDPARGVRWAERFSIAHNPDPESEWPVHHIEFEHGDGRADAQDSAFTMVDFLACDPRFGGHFVPVGADSWHPDMIPVADYLRLGKAAAAAKVPYVLILDAGGGLRRAIVRRGPVSAVRRCMARWHSLQELAGIDNSHVRRALALERQRLEAEFESEKQALRAAVPQATPEETDPASAPLADEGAPLTTAAPAPAERDPDQAWIETEMCTACNDCVDRNNLMFGYNEAKQAYIADLHAGSYRELIEAAENCPVCIIHPGKPWDLAEPGIDELMARAAAL